MLKHMYENDTSKPLGPSPVLWARAPILEAIEDPRVGYYFFEDFLEFEEDNHGLVVGGDNATCVLPADQVGGVVTIGATGADNDEGYMTSGNNEAGFCKIYTSAPRELWFEARFSVSSIADQAVFVGLAEEGLAAANTLDDDTGALGSKDFIGFHADTAAPTALDIVYRKAGQDAVVLKAGAETIAASTWYNVGFHYNGSTIRFAINGAEVMLDTTVTGVNSEGRLLPASATNFPDGEELAIFMAVKTGEAVAKTMLIDWIRVFQRRYPN